VLVENAHGRCESTRIGRLAETAAFVMLNPGARPSELQGALWPGRRSNPQTCRQMISRARTWLGRTDAGEPYLMTLAESEGRLRLRPEVGSDWADFQRLAQGRVVVGHNIAFDLTILREECRRHGRPWEDVVFIDTLRLASLLNPSLGRLDLENLAQLYQVDLHGRHTALGDALVTAELFLRMVTRLQMQGFGTLGELLRFHCTEAHDVIAGQKERGWIHAQPDGLRP
jgi:hypothetical protein